MNRRINKEIARKVADRIADVSYEDKLEPLRKKLRDYADELIVRHIPQEVLNVTKSYAKFFRITTWIWVKSCNHLSLYVESNLELPADSQMLVDIAEYNQLKKMRMDLSNMENQRKAFSYKLQDALCDLKTEKRISEIMPEAMPYLSSYLNDDTTLQKSGPLESLRKQILTPKKDG